MAPVREDARSPLTSVRRLMGAASMAMVVAMLAVGIACEDRNRGEGSPDLTTLERIRQAGAVPIGYANEAPYAYVDPETGAVTGESPEIARVILERMGLGRVEGVLTEFGSLIPALKADRFDLIAAGMYITPERCEQIAFSNPTYGIGQAFLVKEGNPLDLHGYEDIAAHARARLGVVAGGVELGYARALEIPDGRIVVLPDAPSAVAAVQAGRVDAYAGTSLTIRTMLGKAEGRGLEEAAPFTDPVIDGKRVIGYGAFGFRKEDRRLRDTFNRHLEAFIGTEEHLELVRRFGFTKADLPGEVAAEELCRS